MTNQQLYLSIGLPMFTIIIGFLLQNKRFDQMEARVDRIDDRMDRIENQLAVIAGDLRQFYQTLGRHEEAIDTLKKKA